jgi:biotin carboxyl carrier protein
MAGRTHRVKVKKAGDGYVVATGDRTQEVSLRRISDRSLQLVTGREVFAFHTVTDGRARYVMMGGRTFRIEKGAGQGERVRKTLETFRPGLYELKSPMPGRVVRVLKGPGAYVERGGELVVLEAMKMENLVIAPTAIMVLEAFVRPGDLVEGGTPLLLFEVF